MASSFMIPLREIARRPPVLEVACSRCPRRGRYHTAKLVARFGDDTQAMARIWLARHRRMPFSK
jgi:hypothetical protein